VAAREECRVRDREEVAMFVTGLAEFIVEFIAERKEREGFISDSLLSRVVSVVGKVVSIEVDVVDSLGSVGFFRGGS
jgi:uncharacterized membrane protein YeaQ/YmgE (transglycosylase-associated protein family)